MEVHLVEPLRHHRRERTDALEQLVVLGGVSMLLLKGSELFVEGVDTPRHDGRTLLEFLLVNEAGLIGIEQAASLGTDPRQPLLGMVDLRRQE